MVVTRTDTASGLSSVRFIDPETYRLDRLSSLFVGPLLAELAKDKDGQKVIEDREYGWTSLLARLSGDLERAGTILPQQLKIVLAGLGTLPGRVLTVAAYERAGGTAGLEARFIEDRIAKAARLHGVTEDRVRTALLTLVDPVNGQKTVERASGALRSCIDPATPDKAQPVLDLLANEEVIRRRMDPGLRESSWLLDHDYLARAVREADRRANKWQRALAEGAKALAGAVGWAPRWRALLTPRTQVAFFFDRLCGRFRYAGYRAYAIISLERLGPYVAIFFTVVALGIYEAERRSEQEIQTASDDILNGLVFRDSKGISGDEAGTLLRLASAEEAVRRRVLTQVLTDQHRASAFVLNPELVIRAIVGVSPRSRVLAATSLRGATAQLSENPPLITQATAEAARVLGVSEALPLEWWMAAIRGSTDPDVLG